MRGIDFTKAVMYKTVCSDLSDLSDVKYDMLVFFLSIWNREPVQELPRLRAG